ncbi:PAM68 family protein [Cyanobacterium aponinum]|uniref:PAM68 family protein n=1 Tax=Cyanobacterium aponinum TaxID=379064 RepID=UPI000C12A682|nr:PAM68 family protein [Cyanobacterium aponinum]PHV63853.1 hypothetical protein CSQ80_03325 [Cyanobacterium aponinum IPPAS B-1201]
MPSPANRNSLPFEPKKSKNKKVNDKNLSQPKETQRNQTESKVAKSSKGGNSLQGIPEVVSKRMVRRMAVFSGIPTAMGIFSFFAFYAIVSQEWFKIPNTAVLLVSMGLFGLGVLGLSYGILSTSWDEERVGSWWGWSEFVLNFGRFTSAWRNNRQKSLNEE